MSVYSWVLDIHSGDITLNGQKVARLSASETYVLALLASNEGNLLSKDQLLDTGWPEKVVSLSSLTVAIKNIRKALSTCDTPTYIETLHRKGYIYHGGGAQFSLKEMGASDNEQKTLYVESGRPTTGSQTTINLEANTQTSDEQGVTQPPSNNMRMSGRQRSNYSRIVGWSVFSIAYIFFFSLATFVFASKNDLICYQMDQANACGRFKLDNAGINEVKIKLHDKTGDYLYGYTKSLDGIEIFLRH